MSTIDLSRDATDFKKHYAGVRMQQGRVLTDDDFNEAARLEAEGMRRTRLETIGPFGSPDAGFLPKNVRIHSGKPSFDITAGTLYLGGLRLELPADEPFHTQKDWLSFNSDADGPSSPSAGQTRTDLIWIEAWQQPVTAIEDQELFEVALGGPDTTARIRTMRRVHILTDVGTEKCATAWKKACTEWGALGSMADDMEFEGAARLSVRFTATSSTGNLCSPDRDGGYLGAENQAIRVQAISGTHFTWGFDNAAPLYRAVLMSDPERGPKLKLELLTPPKDAVHWPLKGQVVELLPWSAELSNGERAAEISGHLTKVASSYDPDEKTLTIETAPPEAFDLYADKEHFVYVRIWNRGEDISSPEIPLASGTLGQTGLSVSFKGSAPRAGDYWIIAARPLAPEVVTPWSLNEDKNSEGAKPHGIKRYRAPLAIIRWQNNAGTISGSVVHDCRATFVPLAAGWWVGGCSIVVAPRQGWERVFNLFQPGQDVSICFQVGDYQLDHMLVLEKLRTIKMTGAGSGTRIIASGCETAFLFRGCESVIVRELHVETLSSPLGRETAEQHLNGVLTFLDCHDVRVSDCDLVCPVSTVRQQSCLTVRSNAASVRDLVRIERNRLVVGAWQTGILLVDVDRSIVSGNHLSLSKFMPTRGWRAIPGSFAGTFEQLVLEAVSSTAVSGSYGLSFTRSDTRLQVLKGSVAEPLVHDFAKVARKNVAKAPGGVEGALKKFARGVAAGRSISALSSAGKAAIGKIIEDLHAGGQGIVVAGTRIGTVQIIENIVEDMIQGIHIGVSNPTIAGPEIAGEIMIARNVLHSMVPRLFNRDRHAIFVGNARSISITDTVASLRRIGRSKNEETQVEGIRIHGVLGPFMVIRQSSLSGFTIGVRVAPLDPIPKQRVWLVAETMATGASVNALLAPKCVERDRNVPEINVP